MFFFDILNNKEWKSLKNLIYFSYDGCDEDEKHDDDEVDVDGNDGDMIRCRVRS